MEVKAEIILLVIVFMEMVDTQVVSVVLKEVGLEEISFAKFALSTITQLPSVETNSTKTLSQLFQCKATFQVRIKPLGLLTW